VCGVCVCVGAWLCDVCLWGVCGVCIVCLRMCVCDYVCCVCVSE